MKLSNDTVGKWRGRFLERSIAGLYDDVRPGPARSIDDERVRKLNPGSVGIATSALRFRYKVTLKRDWTPDDFPLPKKRFRLPVWSSAPRR